jgi:hypothetical protein
MDNPFERRATEQVRNEEAFLALISPEPVLTYLGKYGAAGKLYDRLTILLGTPGSGKTTMAKLFEFPMVNALLRNSASQAHRALLTTLIECGCITGSSPNILAYRLPLESDYREIWEFPYSDELRDGLLRALIQARSVLGWFRYLQRAGVTPNDVKVITTGISHAGAEAIGGDSGESILERARAVEQDIYRVVGALLPPTPGALGEAAISAYRPFDVIDRFVVSLGGLKERELRPLVMFDDAHTLHPTQFRNLTRWLIRRELRVSRWVLTRFDVLDPNEALSAILKEGSEDTELPGVTTAREITRVTLQSLADRRGQRTQFRKMAKDMSGRYLSQMPEFSSRKLTSLEGLMIAQREHLTRAKTSEIRNRVDLVQTRLHVANERRHRLEEQVDEYKPAGEALGEDERLAILSILMHRYANRIPQQQQRLFEEGANFDPDPTRPLTVKSSVYEAACLQLFHSYDRPYYFGIEDLCDASSENAEQFLRLAAILVEAVATRLIRGRPATLQPRDQHQLLRERAGEFMRDWNFPYYNYVRTLVALVAERCLSVSLEPNAWIGAGANAYGVLQDEFEHIGDSPELCRTLKYAVAYNAITLVPRYECKNKLWCLIELGGIPKLHHGLTLMRGGFIEGTLGELKGFNRSAV